MDSPSKLESLASRYAPYVGDLHEFFITTGMPFGSPEDLVPFAAAITVPGAFREDVCSLVRSIIYRENKAIPLVDLLQLLVVAAGGSGVDDTAADLHEPIRQLLSFVREVYRSLQQRAASTASEVEPEPVAQRVLPAGPAVAAISQAVDEGDASAAVFPATGAEPSILESVAQPPPAAPVSEAETFQSRSAIEAEPPLATSQAAPVAMAVDEPGSSTEQPPAPVEERPTRERPTAAAEPSLAAAKRPAVRPLTPSRKPQIGHRAAAIGTIAAAAVLAFGSWLLLHHPAAPPLAAPQTTARQNAPAHRVLPTENNAVVLPQAAPLPPPDRVSSPEPAEAGGDAGTPDAEPGMNARHGSQRHDPAPVALPRSESARTPARSIAAQNSFAAPEPLPKAIYADKAESTGEGSGRSSRPERHSGAVSVSSGIMANNLLAAPPPEYPVLAKMTHVEGQVVLQAFVARDGSVIATHTLRGHRLLRGAAEHAVRRWRYRPYLVEGRATDVATIVTVDFRLHP